MSSLYIHIPFCISKCAYCSFVSFSNQDQLFPRYVQALLIENRLVREQYSQLLETVFFGGGTPSILSISLIEKILSGVCAEYNISNIAELSMEVNPGTVNIKKLACLYELGINRISIGVQSFIDTELKAIGRIHSVKSATSTVNNARSAGFKNISLDLMFGLPGQDYNSFKESLSQAISLKPEHLSIYQLSIEEGTDFYDRFTQGHLILPNEEEIEKIDNLISVDINSSNLARYEISNYAKQGCECKHNINYWQNNSYAAIGAGAVGYIDGIRYRNISDPIKYCEFLEKGKRPILEEEKLDNEASFRETVIMGLRMKQGVDVQRLKKRFGYDLEEYYGKIITELVDKGFLECSPTHLKMTNQGTVFANQIMADLV